MSSMCGMSSEAGSTPIVTLMNSSVARTTSLDLEERRTHVLDSSLLTILVPSRSGSEREGTYIIPYFFEKSHINSN